MPLICPNHGCPLVDLPKPLPPRGVGICSISGAQFEFEAKPETKKLRVDKMGKVTEVFDYNTTGDE